MKMLTIATAAVLGFGSVLVVNAAEETKPDAKQEAPATQPATKPAIANKKCPVGGEDVDPKVKTVVYKGKTVGFCCSDCIDDFNKDPEKYAKKLEEKKE
jgi:YHS domain-containing protein